MLDFAQLEKNAHFANYQYSPQNVLGTPSFMAKNLAETVELAHTIGGSRNTYTWFMNGDTLVAEQSIAIAENGISINPTKLSHGGTYQLKVSSDSLDAVILETAPTYLAINAIPVYRNFIFEEDDTLKTAFNLDSIVNFPPEILNWKSVTPRDEQILSALIVTNEVRLEWPENYFGSSYIEVSYEHDFGIMRDSLLLTVLPVNDAPFVTKLKDTVVTSPGFIFIPFEYQDVDNAFEDLSASIAANNPQLFSDEAISISLAENGTGTATLDPVEGISGTDMLEISITDGDSVGTYSFEVIVELPLGWETTNSLIHPNPTQDWLILKSIPKQSFYKILNLFGQTVKMGDVVERRINTKGLASGNYILLLDQERYRFIKK